MKPFNLEKAKAGQPICTRNGLKARIICFDADNDMFPIVGLVKEVKTQNEFPICFTKEGKYLNLKENKFDLFMVGEKKK